MRFPYEHHVHEAGDLFSRKTTTICALTAADEARYQQEWANRKATGQQFGEYDFRLERTEEGVPIVGSHVEGCVRVYFGENPDDPPQIFIMSRNG